MGFSNIDSAQPQKTPIDEMSHGNPHGPNFGQRLEQYAKDRYPVAGGLMGQVFGAQQQQPQMQAPALAPMPDGSMQQPDMIGMNAQPKSSGMSNMIVKLLMGG